MIGHDWKPDTFGDFSCRACGALREPGRDQEECRKMNDVDLDDVARWLVAMAAFAGERCGSCGRTRDNHNVRHRWVGNRVAPGAPPPERLRLAADALDANVAHALRVLGDETQWGEP